MSTTLRRVWRLVIRVARMARTLITSRELPLWLRALFAVMLFGTQFLLGPIDDILLLLPIGITWLFYRRTLVSAWHRSAASKQVSACWHLGAMEIGITGSCGYGCKISHCDECVSTLVIHRESYGCHRTLETMSA